MNRIDRRRFLLGTSAAIGLAACSTGDDDTASTTSRPDHRRRLRAAHDRAAAPATILSTRQL